MFFGAVFLWILPVFLRTYRISIVNDTVIVKRGIFITTTHIFPFTKLIYTKSYTSFLAKRLNLVAISLKATASSLFIAELERADAEALLEEIARGKSYEN